MSKHTPGPLTAEQDGMRGWEVRKDDVLICFMAGQEQDEQKANAVLYAAAPDMADALALTRDLLAYLAIDHPAVLEDARVHFVATSVNTALNKALGES